MRPLSLFLMTLFVLLQYKLWFGDMNLRQWWHVEQNLHHQQEKNKQLVARNKALKANIQELKQGSQALEEEARYNLGMIKEEEAYYQFSE